jgi:hypothetical protein
MRTLCLVVDGGVSRSVGRADLIGLGSRDIRSIADHRTNLDLTLGGAAIVIQHVPVVAGLARIDVAVTTDDTQTV